MRHTTFFAVLGPLLSLVRAASLPIVQDKSANKPKTTSKPLGVLWTEVPNPQSVCSGQTTLTSSGLDSNLPRALWSDCRYLLDKWNARNTRGLFTITRPSGHPEQDFFYPVLYHESCYLAISPGCDAAQVGDIDIGRVLQGALQQTSRGGTMASEGEMMCRKKHGWGCIHKTKWKMYGDLIFEDEGCKVKNGKKKDKDKKKNKDRRAQREDVEQCGVR